MLSSAAETIGGIFMIVGAFFIASIVVGFLTECAANFWMKASRKWRGIFKAEALICEYKREREKYLKWKEKKDGKAD